MNSLLLVVLALVAVSEVQVALARIGTHHVSVSHGAAGHHSKVLRKANHGRQHKRRRLLDDFGPSEHLELGDIKVVERIKRPEFWEKMKSIEVNAPGDSKKAKDKGGKR